MKKMFVLTLYFIFALSSLATAEDVSLSWDLNSDADYYVVYFGTASGEYSQETEPITETTTTIEIFSAGTWFFSVKAFNCYGNSSDFSDEVSTILTGMTCPELTQVKKVYIK